MNTAEGKNVNSYVALEKSSDIVDFLKRIGLGNEDQYAKLDKTYTVAVYVKRRSDDVLLNKKTGEMQRLGGSPGNTAITKDLASSIFKKALGKSYVNDSFVDISGTPSVTSSST